MRSALEARVAKLEQARLVPALWELQVYCTLHNLGHAVLLYDMTGVQTPISPDELTVLCALDEKRGADVRRNLLSRLEKLETTRGTLAPAVIYVDETPQDIREGKSLWDLAMAQGKIPLAVLEGRQTIGLLVPAKVSMEDWPAYARAYQDYEASIPRCPQCHTKLWKADRCPVCEGQRGRPSAPVPAVAPV